MKTLDHNDLAALQARVAMLEEQLAARDADCGSRVEDLERINEALRLRERAMEASDEGITIADVRQPHAPLIYANAGFERLTGYTREETLGRNCRFLQGPETDPETVDRIKTAMEAGQPVMVELLNYRKNGEPFWNRLSLTPVRDAAGALTHYVGVQSDITRRVESEYEARAALEALEAANDQLTRANRRMRGNLEAAAKVQRNMLPERMPRLPNLRFAWRYRPSDELAGDLFNVFWLDDKHVGLYLLDVTGHGTAAALLAVSVGQLLTPISHASSLVREQGDGPDEFRIAPPAEVADKLNRRFPWDEETGQFFTLIYGVLNVESLVFTYVSAGHPQPAYVAPRGRSGIPRSKGLPIGLETERYADQQLRLAPGDRLFLYSDGVVETMNPDSELFGFQRLLRSLRKSRDVSLDAALDRLIRDLETWQGARRFRDDLSLLGLEVKRETAA